MVVVIVVVIAGDDIKRKPEPQAKAAIANFVSTETIEDRMLVRVHIAIDKRQRA